MARLNAEQAASFPSGGTSFLSLRDDKDKALVRFAYNSVSEILIDSVHDCKNNEGRNVQVDCLRHDKSEPESLCPLCASGSPIKKTVFLNVRNEATGEMQVWQRSYAYVEKNIAPILNSASDYGKTPLSSIVFEITRNGVRGDTKTSYTLVTKKIDNMSLNEFPEEIVPQEKGMIKVLSFDEMQNYVTNGIFPDKKANTQNAEIRPREESQMQMGQPARVEDYNTPNRGISNQPYVNNTRRTMGNDFNGGY